MNIIQAPIIIDTEPIEEMLNELKDVLNLLNKVNEHSAELINKLHDLPIPRDDIAMVLEVLFGGNE